jgi:ADP-ribose pyrophosphatase YjhB (NUDIX family)
MKKIKAYGICLYKKTTKSYEILLCKSILSQEKYGFLKGVQKYHESSEETALREFEEESSICVNVKYLEKLFYQENNIKDIGIFLVNYHNIKNVDLYFSNNILEYKYLCNENSNVEFFDIKKLPKIKNKQNKIAFNIKSYLTNKI